MSSSLGPVAQPRPAQPTQTTTVPQLEGLCRGSRGPDVVALQQALNARGAQLEPDGKFGPLTEAALKKFQAQSGCGGDGRVDAGTVTALQRTTPTLTTPPTPTLTTSPPTPALTARPTAETQAGTRARCAADEGRVRAQMAPVPTKPAATTTPTTTPTAPTPATTTPPQGLALSPEQMTAALSHVETGKKQITEEKAVLGQVQEALQREVKALETPPAGKTRSVADEAVLAGRRGQLEAVSKAAEVLDVKAQGYDAVATAVKDGVLTPTEAERLGTVDTAVRQGEAAVTSHFQASSSLVERGLKAGGRGSPTLGLKKSEAPATGTTPPAGKAIAAAELVIAQERIAAATAGVRAEQQTVAAAKTTIEAQVKTLQALQNRTPADDAVLAGRQAQLQVIGKAAEHLDIRAQGLAAASRALSDGILTPDEEKNLGTLDQSLSAAEQQIAARASLATELVNRGIAAGGRSGAAP